MGVFMLVLSVAAALLVAVLSALVLAQVLRLRFTPPQFEVLLPQAVPEAARERLAPGLAQLLALGFAHPVALKMVTADRPLHSLVLLHADVPAAAWVSELPQAEHGRGWTLFFASRSDDGHTLVTRNRSSVAGPLPLPDVTTQDCWLHTWHAVWQAHRRRMQAMAARGKVWRWHPAAAWAEQGGRAETAGFHHRVARGELMDAGDGSWRIAWRPALAMLGRAWLTAPSSLRRMAGDPPAAVPQGAETVQRLVADYERDAEARRGGGASHGAKWLLFLATAAMAAISFGLSLAWSAVPALLLVLLVHELGHFFAMRWAGYRDLKVFFLPFLGAAVSGRHEHPSAGQELTVLFAGPVPGLVLGLAGLAWLPPDLPLAGFWHDCAALAVTINVFNLLPIHPLDGGKIFEILLLGRWPWLAFAARVLGVAAFAAMAMGSDDVVMQGVLWGLVLLMLLGMGHQHREASLAAALRRRGATSGMSRGDALNTLFETQLRLGQGALPWPTQRLLAEALLPALTRPRLTRGTRAGGLMVYAFFLMLPVLALVASLGSAARGGVPAPAPVAEAGVPPAEEAQRAAQALDNELAGLHAELLALPEPVGRWALLRARFDDLPAVLAASDAARGPSAQALWREAEALAAVQPDAASARALLALWRARAEPAAADRRQALLDLLSRYDDATRAPSDREPQARAALDWLYEAGDEAAAQRLQVVDRVLTQRQGSPLPALLARELREHEAGLRMTLGDGASALAQARSAFDAELLARSGDSLHGRVHAALLRVDLVLALQGPAAALAELEPLLARLEAGPDAQRNELSSLRRHGMLLAELAGRADWQRAQSARLPPLPQAGDGLPWWGSLLIKMSGQPAPVPHWAQLERLHWQGDQEGAQRVAAAMRARGVRAQPSEPAGSDALQAARQRLETESRLSLARRYGLASAQP